MQDRQLYQQILGITSPWSVERVELALKDGQVRVFLQHAADATWCCPECDRTCPVHDHQPERAWRHLDTCQYQTVLYASLPRVDCPQHGVKVVRVPWAEPHSRFTALFERLVIEWLHETSQSAVAGRMGLSWDEVHGIMDRAVKRGLARRQAGPIVHLGVDEKSFRKGHRYATIVNDLDQGCVLYVAKDRKQTSLDGFWGTITPAQKEGIQAVAMDMCDAYESSVRKHLPNGQQKIVFDKFHVAKQLGEAVDRVRRAENKVLKAEGDERLVGTKYDWLRNPKNFAADQWREFAELRKSKLKTARAWVLREQAMVLWDYKYEGAARNHFLWWYRWATHSRLKPMIEKAKMLGNRLANILTYLKHPITNATSESINSKIQWVKYTARGFRNFDNFATAIYFHCGGLELAPSPTK
jgi:transposase